jgi:hypothetical protein
LNLKFGQAKIGNTRKKKTFPYPILQEDGTYKLIPTIFKEGLPSTTVTIPNSKIKNFYSNLLYYFPSFKDFPNQNGDKLFDLLEEYDDEYTLLNKRSIFEGYGSIIIITAKTELNKPRKVKLAEDLLAADLAPKLIFQYIEYQPDFSAPKLKQLIGINNLNKWLQKNYKENSCVYSTIINAYRESFEKLKKQGRYVNVDLNYEYLWSIIHPNEKYSK